MKKRGGRRRGAGRPRLYARDPAAASKGIDLICKAAPALVDLEVQAAHGRLRGAAAKTEAGRARRALIERWLGKPNQPISIAAPPDGVDEGQIPLFVEEFRRITEIDPSIVNEVLGSAFGGQVPAAVLDRLKSVGAAS